MVGLRWKHDPKTQPWPHKCWTAWTVLHLNKHEGAAGWALFIAGKKMLLTEFTFFLMHTRENKIKCLSIRNQSVENQCCRQCCSLPSTFTHHSCWCSFSVHCLQPRWGKLTLSKLTVSKITAGTTKNKVLISSSYWLQGKQTSHISSLPGQQDAMVAQEGKRPLCHAMCCMALQQGAGQRLQECWRAAHCRERWGRSRVELVTHVIKVWHGWLAR